MDNKPMSSPELPLPGAQSSETDQGMGNVSQAEAQHFSAEAVSQQAPLSQATATSAVNAAQSQTGATQTAAQPQTIASIAQTPVADDADVIEKEWVSRAKAIVNRTRNDPREQSRELSSFKAEYVKKRFHKDMKIAEEAA